MPFDIYRRVNDTLELLAADVPDFQDNVVMTTLVGNLGVGEYETYAVPAGIPPVIDNDTLAMRIIVMGKPTTPTLEYGFKEIILHTPMPELARTVAKYARDVETQVEHVLPSNKQSETHVFTSDMSDDNTHSIIGHQFCSDGENGLNSGGYRSDWSAPIVLPSVTGELYPIVRIIAGESVIADSGAGLTEIHGLPLYYEVIVNSLNPLPYTTGSLDTVLDYLQEGANIFDINVYCGFELVYQKSITYNANTAIEIEPAHIFTQDVFIDTFTPSSTWLSGNCAVTDVAAAPTRMVVELSPDGLTGNTITSLWTQLMCGNAKSTASANATSSAGGRYVNNTTWDIIMPNLSGILASTGYRTVSMLQTAQQDGWNWCYFLNTGYYLQRVRATATGWTVQTVNYQQQFQDFIYAYTLVRDGVLAKYHDGRMIYVPAEAIGVDNPSAIIDLTPNEDTALFCDKGIMLNDDYGVRDGTLYSYDDTTHHFTALGSYGNLIGNTQTKYIYQYTTGSNQLYRYDSVNDVLLDSPSNVYALNYPIVSGLQWCNSSATGSDINHTTGIYLKGNISDGRHAVYAIDIDNMPGYLSDPVVSYDESRYEEKITFISNLPAGTEYEVVLIYNNVDHTLGMTTSKTFTAPKCVKAHRYEVLVRNPDNSVKMRGTGSDIAATELRFLSVYNSANRVDLNVGPIIRDSVRLNEVAARINSISRGAANVIWEGAPGGVVWTGSAGIADVTRLMSRHSATVRRVVGTNVDADIQGTSPAWDFLADIRESTAAGIVFTWNSTGYRLIGVLPAVVMIWDKTPSSAALPTSGTLRARVLDGQLSLRLS